ncbi:MAG: YihA family ribosome biogenesis GTP-binding protein [Bacteroidales bacterium]|nr:YihA family ribosome biogenesis GTP-binding protein [Bacteroidales bacterium]
MKVTRAIFAGSSTRVSQKPARRLPEFAFIGRSNVGKSSLINMLCGRNGLAMTSATPGKTRVVNHFLINDAWYLVDLPGYGYAKLARKGRQELADAIRDYILHSCDLQMLFVLVDCRHDIGRTDIDFIAELGEHGIPFSLVFTKTDKTGPKALQERIARDEAILLQDWEFLPPAFCTSARTGAGRDELLAYIDSILKSYHDNVP